MHANAPMPNNTSRFYMGTPPPAECNTKKKKKKLKSKVGRVKLSLGESLLGRLFSGRLEEVELS